MTRDRIVKALHGVSWGAVAAGLTWLAGHTQDTLLKLACIAAAGACAAIGRVLEAPKAQGDDENA